MLSSGTCAQYTERMDRYALDALVAHYGLARSAQVGAVLDVARAKPSVAETRQFARRVLHVAGALSIAAGIVFFVAANWQALHVLGRLALIEASIVVAIGVALWRPPPERWGKVATLLAFIGGGALLAAFGQTYQTGADVYELFLAWTALGLLLAVAGGWSVTWAAWVVVLNTFLALYFGFHPGEGAIGLLFAGMQGHRVASLLMPALVNIGIWLVLRRTGERVAGDATPLWLQRLVLTCAVGFGTAAGLSAITGGILQTRGMVWSDAITLVAVVGGLIAIVALCLRWREDVFPLALVAASVIALGTAALARLTAHNIDEGLFLLLALWLIGASAATARMLTSVARAWRGAAGAGAS